MHVARVRASVFATFATVASLFVSYVVLLILHLKTILVLVESNHPNLGALSTRKIPFY